MKANSTEILVDILDEASWNNGCVKIATLLLQCSDYNLIGSCDPINRVPDGLSLPSANDNVLSGDESHSISSYTNDDIANNIISNNKMKILYTNADQFLNKRDLLLAQITGNTCPDIIMISEILTKSPSATINLSFIPGYYTYLNFDPDNNDQFSTNMCGVGIFVHYNFQVSQVCFDVLHFNDHVWASIKLKESDSLLVGC